MEYEAQAVLETHDSVVCDCGCTVALHRGVLLEDGRRGDWNEVVTSCPDHEQIAYRSCGYVGYRTYMEEGECPVCWGG